MFPSLDQRMAWMRRRPYLASFLVGLYLPLALWAISWAVGFHVPGSDVVLWLGLGLFLGGPLVVWRARQRPEGAAAPTSVGFRSLPRSLRTPSSALFCLLPLVTAGVVTPMCLGYASQVLGSRRLRAATLVSWGFLLTCLALVNHSRAGGAAETAGIWLGLLNAIAGTVVLFQCRRQLRDSE